MNLTYTGCRVAKSIRMFLAIFIIAILSGCGGGGGNAKTPDPVVVVPVNTTPVLTATLTDASGAPITSLSGGDLGTIKAKFVSGTGIPIANAVVTYSGDLTLVQFSPATGTALTDAAGIATIIVKPAGIDSAGALSISVQAVSGALTAASQVNLSIGAAPLTVGALTVTPVQSTPLPAFSSVVINIPVTSKGLPVTTVSGLILSSQCTGDGTASIVQGSSSSANGIFSATYTNKGCTRGTDQISASIGNSSQSIALNVGSANIGSMLFVGTDTAGAALVLKGTGGVGRKESAVVTFKVVDETNVGLSGVTVNFSATTTTGGLSVQPIAAVTDISGNVSTTVSSGTIPTPVKVIASATRNGKTISGLSDSLTISTGLPIQKAMSLSVDKYNIEGWDYDNEIASVNMLLADQYGNPVADNTTINFVTEGGAIGTSKLGACNTLNGACSVNLRSQAFRPANGRVTVLAYAQGIEDFVDKNGDGQYSCTNFVDSNGNVPSTYRPLIDTCLGGGESFTDLPDAFLDAGSLAITGGVSSSGTLDNLYTASNGDLPIPYNHTVYASSGDGKWGINYIRKSAEIIFSGSYAVLLRQFCDGGGCRDWNNSTDGDPQVIKGLAGLGCASQGLTFRLKDYKNNPLPVDTKISTSDAVKISTGTYFPDTILSTNSVGGTMHSVVVKAEAACASGSFLVNVKTPKGNVTVFSFTSN